MKTRLIQLLLRTRRWRTTGLGGVVLASMPAGRRQRPPARSLLSLLLVLAVVVSACGSDEDAAGSVSDAPESDGPDPGSSTAEGDPGSDGGEDGDSDAAMSEGESPYLAGALEEGEVNWYTAHYNVETAEAVAGLFEDAYPGITVNLYRETAQRINQRFVQEEEAGQTVADVLGITEISLVDSLAEQGLLAEFTPANSDNIKSEYAAYDDPSGLYHVAALGNNVLCYNTDQVSEEDAPKAWEDLLDPEWQGQIATGHPGASGYVGTWATWVYLEYGVEYLEQLAGQDVLVGQSVTDTIPRLAAGERVVAACSDQTAALAAEAGDPIGIVYPEDGAVIMPTPNAIPAGAPHPDAARLLADFIVSDEAQTFLAGNQRLIPIVEGIELPAHVPDDATYRRPELAELTENLETVIGEWRRLFGV